MPLVCDTCEGEADHCEQCDKDIKQKANTFIICGNFLHAGHFCSKECFMYYLDENYEVGARLEKV